MNRRARLVLAGLLTVILLSGLGGMAAGDSQGSANSAPRKIVVFEEWFVSEAAQQQLIERTGGTLVKTLPIINGAAVYLPLAVERAVSQRAEVLRIDIDAVASTQAKPPKPPPQQPPEVLPWGIDRIDADLVWDTDHDLAVDAGANAGGGVVVAVVDTGIDLDHPDLKDNVKGGVNTINARKSADDDNGHGTHVAGIIAGADNTGGVLGVAPKAGLYAVKVLDRNGNGFLSDIIEGLQWVVANKSAKNISVVNMSFGTSSDVQSLHDAITAAYDAGLVLVAADGNYGEGTVIYPAGYTEVIAVSATDDTDAIASFSSRGVKVDVAAPGVGILSTYKGGSYATLSGTSMASPHVAGAAALVVASGITDRDLVRAQILSTADDLGAAGPDDVFGYGLVDAEEAATGVQTG